MNDDTHYFAARPSAKSHPQPVAVRLSDVNLDIQSDSGVFSKGALDRGTEFLLRAAPGPPTKGAILDLGCGYGAIALVTALRHPHTDVWAVDVNERALELTRRNAAAAGIDNVHAATPDEVPADLRLAAIYSNPPVRVGKASLHEMLTRWLDRLVVDGRAFLVMHRYLGADSLVDWLNLNGYPTERLRSRQGYRLLTVTPKRQDQA